MCFVEIIMNTGKSQSTLTLTPTLSPGEREKLSLFIANSDTLFQAAAVVPRCFYRAERMLVAMKLMEFEL